MQGRTLGCHVAAATLPRRPWLLPTTLSPPPSLQGNAYAGLGDWEAAAENYGRATQLAPAFAFARENRALALYQLGQDNAAIKEMRCGLGRGRCG